jgi:signal-transduction protein with cAMP-binding, CBS, and nucleotidyltransferase domain
VLVIHPADQSLLGIVTERDILRKIALPRLDPDQVPVEQIMTPELVSCAADIAVSEAQALMVSNNIRHLPVVEDGCVVGILSSRDVLMHQLSSLQGIGQSLTRIVEQFRAVFPTMHDQAAPVA